MATGTLPFPIDETMLTAHSVAEPSPGELTWTSGATFELGDKCIVGAPSATVTITQADPAVVSWASHNLPNGTPVVLATTGALPTGLSTGRIYYMVNRQAGSFQLSETLGGQPVATTSAGSGTHTATGSVHRTYQSLAPSNTGNPPATDDGSKWQDVGPTNLWAMLDLYRPSITWGASPMTFTVRPGRTIRSLFFGSLDGVQLDVVQKRAGVAIKSWSKPLMTRSIQSFTDYFYKRFNTQQSVLISDVLLYNDTTFEVTLTKDSGQAGIGEVMWGDPVYLGKTQYGAKRKNRNYTKFDRNTDGTPQAPVKRRNVPSSDQTIMFSKDDTGVIMRFLDDANGAVVLISGLDDDTHPYFEPTLILGLITGSDLDLSHPNDGYLSLSAEEF